MTRLQREDWLQVAQRALATYGLAGVRIEALARELSASKGSFYWHFADRAELLETLFLAWEQQSDWLIAESRKEATPPARLARLLALIAGNDHERLDVPDTAIFLWARQDARIAERVAAVEQRRIAYLEELLRGHGIPATTARRRAAFATAAFNGYVEQLARRASMLSFADFELIVTRLFTGDPVADGG